MRRLIAFAVFCLVVPALGQETSPQEGQAKAAAVVDAVPPEVAEAEAAMVKSDWKMAEPILDTWLAAHPTDAHALFDAGYIADAQGRNDDAVSLYRKAVAGDAGSFEAQISLGLLLARMGRVAEARPALAAATTLDPGPAGPEGKAKAWRALAQIDLRGFDDPDGEADADPNPKQASVDLLEALKLSPETENDTLLAANLAEDNGDNAGAEGAYRRVLKKDPDSSAAVAGLVHQLIAQKEYPEAEEMLQTAVKKAPEDTALTAQLAAVLVAEDKVDALPLLQQFHKNHPQDLSIARMLAKVEADAGDYAESDRLYLALLAGAPKDSELLSGHGQNLIRLRRYMEAVKVFESATEIDETNGDAWNGLAFASFQAHQPEVTLHALTVRSKYLPESAIIYFLWATAYDTLHDKKQAVAYYHRFLDSGSGKFPDQEWQARQRLALLEKSL